MSGTYHVSILHYGQSRWAGLGYRQYGPWDGFMRMEETYRVGRCSNGNVEGFTWFFDFWTFYFLILVIIKWCIYIYTYICVHIWQMWHHIILNNVHNDPHMRSTSRFYFRKKKLPHQSTLCFIWSTWWKKPNTQPTDLWKITIVDSKWNINHYFWYTGVSQNRGYLKMDGENNGQPYVQMDDLGGSKPLFLETPIYMLVITFWGLLLLQKKSVIVSAAF